VRERPGLQGVTIAALTGWGEEEDRRRTREGGFDYPLVKPVDLADLEKGVPEVEGKEGLATDGAKLCKVTPLVSWSATDTIPWTELKVIEAIDLFAVGALERLPVQLEQDEEDHRGEQVHPQAEAVPAPLAGGIGEADHHDRQDDHADDDVPGTAT
jgi:hypothetical protein